MSTTKYGCIQPCVTFTPEQWREIMATPLPRYTGAQLGAIAAAYRWRVPGLSKRRARAAVLGYQQARSGADAMRMLLAVTEHRHRRARRRGIAFVDPWRVVFDALGKIARRS